jgi:hypothetical protein
MWDVYRKTGVRPCDLSLIERRIIKRPALERRLLAFYRKRQQRARRTATA